MLQTRLRGDVRAYCSVHTFAPAFLRKLPGGRSHSPSAAMSASSAGWGVAPSFGELGWDGLTLGLWDLEKHGERVCVQNT